jgi:hypothetical protein
MTSGDAAAAADLMREQLEHDYKVMRALAVMPESFSPALQARRQK